MAVTLFICLFIVRTYYGFWTLKRNATLNPVETTRAFNAPIFHGTPSEWDTPRMLKKIGGKHLQDGAVATPSATAGRL